GLRQLGEVGVDAAPRLGVTPEGLGVVGLARQQEVLLGDAPVVLEAPEDLLRAQDHVHFHRLSFPGRAARAPTAAFRRHATTRPLLVRDGRPGRLLHGLSLQGPDGNRDRFVVAFALEDAAGVARQGGDLIGVGAVAARLALDLLEPLPVMERDRAAAAAARARDVLVETLGVQLALPSRPDTSLAQAGERRCAREAASESSSSACERDASVTVPESMRASSSTRSRPVTGLTVVSVRPPSWALLTTKCASAYAATCARCVTTRTCLPRPSSPRSAPTSRAALPPTPASTSSNARVGCVAPVTRWSASIRRESSPPEAICDTGPGGSPTFAPKRNETSSAPLALGSGSGVTATSKTAPGMPSRASSGATCASSRWAAARLAAVTVAASRSSSALSCASSRARPASSSSRASRSSRSRAAASRKASTAATSSPYLRLSASSFARRACTASRRAGSASKPARNDSTSAATA